MRIRRRTRSAPIAAALFGLAVTTFAGAEARAAESKTSSLSWLRMPSADGCVATQPLARAIEERLGRAVFVSAAQADLSVEGRIEKRPSGWHAVITVRDASGATLGTRELDRSDASCDAMTDPLALVVAVMIDPDAAMRPARPDPAPLPPASNPPPPANVPTTTPNATEHPVAPLPRDPWRFEAHGHVTVNHGITPTLAPGAGVQAILYPPKIPIGFRGYTTLFLPTNAERDGARASFDMLYVGGGLCPTIRGRVNVLFCLGGHLGLLRPRAETPGRGIDEDLRLILNAMAELRIHVPLLAPIGIAAGIGAGVPVVRPRLDFTRTGGEGGGRDTLHRSEAYVLTADVGLGFFFP